jgi:hypothetical protein
VIDRGGAVAGIHPGFGEARVGGSDRAQQADAAAGVGHAGRADPYRQQQAEGVDAAVLPAPGTPKYDLSRSGTKQGPRIETLNREQIPQRLQDQTLICSRRDCIQRTGSHRWSTRPRSLAGCWRQSELRKDESL